MVKKLVQANEHHAINKAFGTEEFGTALEKAMKRPSKRTKKTSFAPSGLGYSGSCFSGNTESNLVLGQHLLHEQYL